MRLILMGTGPFAVPSFQALLEKGHEIAHVVTRPTAPSAGKKEPPMSPVRAWAIEHRLPLADPISINHADTIQWLAEQRADLMVVCDYGQILSRDALSTTKLGGINLHGSLLPRHRGAAPVQWAILSGDSTTGVSVIHMTPALDGGPVLNRCTTEITPSETAEELEARLSQIGVPSTLQAVAMLEPMQSLEDCIGLGQAQDKTLATKAPRLTKEDGELNLHYPVIWLDRLARGLQPWPGSFAHLQFPDGKSLRIILPKIVPFPLDVEAFGLQPGQLLFGEPLKKMQALIADRIASVLNTSFPTATLYAVAIDGLLALPSVQPAGKKLMPAEEFLRGYSRYPTMHLQGIPGSHRLLNKMTCT